MGYLNLAANLLLVAVSASSLGQVPCDYPLKPKRPSFATGDISGRYTNLIFRIFANTDQGRSQGTAFAIDPASGYFLTAQHVVIGATNDEVVGDLDSQPEPKFKFKVVMKLCKVPLSNNQCMNSDGSYDPDPGVDIALLKMYSDDLKVYLEKLGPYQAGFDLLLSSQVPDDAYKAGFPKQDNPTLGARLEPSDKMTVVRDFGLADRPLRHGQWKLSRSVAKGESGSPVMDGGGNIVGVLLQDDSPEPDKAIAINVLEAMEALKGVFKEMPRTQVGRKLSVGIAKNQYKSEADIAGDLAPIAITNKELAAVILDVTEKDSPRFRYDDCPVTVALNDRGLDGIYLSYWVKNRSKIDVDQQRTALLRDANGLFASGLLKAAAKRYEEVLDLKSGANASNATRLPRLESALGAARVYHLMQDPENELKYSNIALHFAYEQGSKEHIALASAYRFNAALAIGSHATALRDAKTSFIQAPGTVYANLVSQGDKESFRLVTAKELTAEEWQSFMNVQQAALEDKLLDTTAGKKGQQKAPGDRPQFLWDPAEVNALGVGEIPLKPTVP